MSKAFARISADGAAAQPDHGALELVCRTDSLAALRAAVDHGADSIRLKWRSTAPGLGHQEFQRTGLKNAIGYALKRNCSVCLELAATPSDPAYTHAILRRAFEAGIRDVSLASPALALYLRIHHPSVGLRFIADERLLSRRALVLLPVRLGISRVTLPPIMTLAQIQALKGAPGIHLEVQACGSGCAIIVGNSERASARHIEQAGDQEPETAIPNCSSGEFASNDCRFGDSGLDSATSLALLPALVQAGVCALIVEAQSRSPASMAQLTGTWRNAIDRQGGHASHGACRLVSAAH